jgi:hypothetical protein
MVKAFMAFGSKVVIFTTDPVSPKDVSDQS